MFRDFLICFFMGGIVFGLVLYLDGQLGSAIAFGFLTYMVMKS